jgi:hypothetical protein
MVVVLRYAISKTFEVAFAARSISGPFSVFK